MSVDPDNMRSFLGDIVCGWNGHEWTDAGGGLDICAVCEGIRDTPAEPSAEHIAMERAQRAGEG